MVGSLALDVIVGWPAWAPEGDAVRQPADEASLTRAATRGDRPAFAQLVELHQRGVFGLCCRLLRDREEAADSAQEAFVRAYAALGSYDATQPFGPWVMRIARNHCLDVLRRRYALKAQRYDYAPRREELDDAAAGRIGEGGERVHGIIIKYWLN